MNLFCLNTQAQRGLVCNTGDHRDPVITHLIEVGEVSTGDGTNEYNFVGLGANTGFVGDGITDLDDCEVEDLTEGEADFSKEVFADKILITGHTPTFLQSEDHRGRIYRRNGQIGIDCGAGDGEALGCLCLDNGKEYYA